GPAGRARRPGVRYPRRRGRGARGDPRAEHGRAHDARRGAAARPPRARLGRDRRAPDPADLRAAVAGARARAAADRLGRDEGRRPRAARHGARIPGERAAGRRLQAPALAVRRLHLDCRARAQAGVRARERAAHLGHGTEDRAAALARDGRDWRDQLARPSGRACDRKARTTRSGYCLSYTETEWIFSPFGPVPSCVTVSVLPSGETVTLAVTVPLPPSFQVFS